MGEFKMENNQVEKDLKTYREYVIDIKKTFVAAHKSEAQDIYLIEGERPGFRVRGVITKMQNLPIWTIETFDAFLLMAFPKRGETDEMKTERIHTKNVFETSITSHGGSHDFNLSQEDNHLRCHMYTAFPKGAVNGKARTIQAVINVRVVPKEMPTLASLNLPDISPILTKRGGIVLVSGRSGDGKSTTVAGIVSEFNRMTDRQRVILTLEDPVEFVHGNNGAWIIQRRIGENVGSYAKATEDALREDTDIVVIGELRKEEEMKNALRLAEVGKLVISTIHANGVEDTIERFVNEFASEEKEKIRTRLKENLVGIIHQNLITVDSGQYPLTSMMLVETPKHRELLRENAVRGKLDAVLPEFGRYAQTREQGFQNLKDRGVVKESDRGILL